MSGQRTGARASVPWRLCTPTSKRHTYHRHSHETYSFGVTDAGAQAFWCRGAAHTSAGGTVMAFNPQRSTRRPRGDRINLWDLFAEGSEFSYATVLHPDGTHEIVAVNPLADGTSDFWTSPTTGKRYGTRWTVNIPALDASLTVVAEPQGQEIQADGGIFEGASSVTGWYRGNPVTGQAYVEQLGNWR